MPQFPERQPGETSSDRTGLEPAVSSGQSELGQSESGDPLIEYLRSEVWLNPYRKPSIQFIELAVRKATLIAVDGDEDWGAVLCYDQRDMVVPIVIMPMAHTQIVRIVLERARDRQIPIWLSDPAAFALSLLPYFAPIPEAMFDLVGEALENLRR